MARQKITQLLKIEMTVKFGNQQFKLRFDKVASWIILGLALVAKAVLLYMDYIGP